MTKHYATQWLANYNTTANNTKRDSSQAYTGCAYNQAHNPDPVQMVPRQLQARTNPNPIPIRNNPNPNSNPVPNPNPNPDRDRYSGCD